jgi:hypothetical protein
MWSILVIYLSCTELSGPSTSLYEQSYKAHLAEGWEQVGSVPACNAARWVRMRACLEIIHDDLSKGVADTQ